MSTNELTSAGLFAGIGGIECGLEAAGFRTELLCEIDPDASAVLRARFPGVHLEADVRSMRALPKVEILAAGFPCQDLSQAGKKAGIEGAQSSLVSEVFRLCKPSRAQPTWLVLENVSYMLRLDRGRAMTQLVRELEELGFQWGYRVIDARSFGIPQRRQRVLFVASASEDVRGVLFADESGTPEYDDTIGPVEPALAYGFYWTEGLRGLGWARDAVPTVKGGSRLGIPSPPAVWLPAAGFFGTPSIADAERLQGFKPGWTEITVAGRRQRGTRWRLVGNAVCVPMAEWLGRRLVAPGEMTLPQRPLWYERWPSAAWGANGESFAVDATMRPMSAEFSLRSFLRDALQPLSPKAAGGFLSRARRGKLRFADGFLDDLEEYLDVEVAADWELIA